MARLKQAGCIATQVGIAGVYRFTGQTEDITLAQVAKAVNARFVSAHWRSGDLNCQCLISSGMGDIMDELFGELNELCMDWLAHRTVSDIDRKIFRKDKEKT